MILAAPFYSYHFFHTILSVYHFVRIPFCPYHFVLEPSEALSTTVLILYCVGVNTLKRYRQLRAKDLLKVPMWRLEWDLNLRPSRRKVPNLPLSHHTS